MRDLACVSRTQIDSGAQQLAASQWVSLTLLVVPCASKQCRAPCSDVGKLPVALVAGYDGKGGKFHPSFLAGETYIPRAATRKGQEKSDVCFSDSHQIACASGLLGFLGDHDQQCRDGQAETEASYSSTPHDDSDDAETLHRAAVNEAATLFREGQTSLRELTRRLERLEGVMSESESSTVTEQHIFMPKRPPQETPFSLSDLAPLSPTHAVGESDAALGMMGKVAADTQADDSAMHGLVQSEEQVRVATVGNAPSLRLLQTYRQYKSAMFIPWRCTIFSECSAASEELWNCILQALEMASHFPEPGQMFVMAATSKAGNAHAHT